MTSSTDALYALLVSMVTFGFLLRNLRPEVTFLLTFAAAVVTTNIDDMTAYSLGGAMLLISPIVNMIPQGTKYAMVLVILSINFCMMAYFGFTA